MRLSMVAVLWGAGYWSRHSHKQARADATADGDDGESAPEKNTPFAGVNATGAVAT